MTKINVAKKYRVQTGVLVTLDLIILQIASFLSLSIGCEYDLNLIKEISLSTILAVMTIHTVSMIVIFIICRMYSNVWKYAEIGDIANILLAASLSTFFIFILDIIASIQLPKSSYIILGLILFTTTILSRFGFRLYLFRGKNSQLFKQRNAMIVGAGWAGSMLIKDLKASPNIKFNIKCMIDDDKSKIGCYIGGVKIVGNRDSILKYARKYSIDDIIIAMPSIEGKIVESILNICKQTGCNLKSVPGYYEIDNEQIEVSRLRDINIEDLLGRNPIKVDLNIIMDYVQDKVVLITGGGGSIGSELVRQIAVHNPRELIIMDIYENNAYEIQQELVKSFPKLKLQVLIASVRNEHRIDKIFETYSPDIVYHAAAHKHVPLMETSPNEAIKNNVFGTFNVAKAAGKYGVSKFVLISTDKAVNPTNIMGASKRICEMIIQTMNKEYSHTNFVAVRFGNVLGSNGSVIPLFKKQIQYGGPVTVTHPDIIRYFMTIPEAVSLVLQAGAYAKGGEIFILDMGEPVKILDLAKNLIRLSGFNEEEIKIEFTGLRAGEKLYEELLMDEEGLSDTENKLIHIGKPISFDEEKFKDDLKRLKILADKDSDEIKDIVKEIVPTYVTNKNKI